MTTLESFDLYEVGGCVRDELMGLEVNDYDYTAVAKLDYAEGLPATAQAFAHLGRELQAAGFSVFIAKPEYHTIRAMFPQGHKHEGMVADFVLARREGPYTDGRRPDWTMPGTLEDDLARRDFSMNAMAKDEDGNLIDLYEGQSSIKHRIIACVGSAEDRIREDALRALRAIRFSITKDMSLSAGIDRCLDSEWLPGALASVSANRKREEMTKMFKSDTISALTRIRYLNEELLEAIFCDGLWLMPTLKE